ncbi:haloacid dehalogenase-like hydrolase domain-containing protein 3 [Galendromus occidentalis]|uniref:Haloacid dehalogenase-like hydrolase domain-containing protein 3 n=1 Tax=Galendromus occidentalis TaxID=34638 RepID=A0AAJ6W0E3_9ACAR|nr:haloacid dehalogenase-like hydrolase domain-containing protein 3 [Galendromus occidentalis]
MNRIAVVSLDFTNTLARFRHAPGGVYAKVAREYGVELAIDSVEKSFRTSFRQLSSDHPNSGRESIGCREFWHRVVSSTLTGAGLDAHPRNEMLRKRISSHLYEAFATEENWKVNDNCNSVLEELLASNLKLIVLSNMDERLDSILKALKIRQYFHIVLSSYDTGFLKPERGIFDCALSKIDDAGTRASAKSIIHVGDDFDCDYIGAKGAGWNALWLNEREELRQLPKDHIVRCLSEVPSSIR